MEVYEEILFSLESVTPTSVLCLSLLAVVLPCCLALSYLVFVTKRNCHVTRHRVVDEKTNHISASATSVNSCVRLQQVLGKLVISVLTASY